MSFLDELRVEIPAAAKRVAELGIEAPLQEFPGSLPYTVLCKREDLSPVNSYKWRGALNAMSVLGETSVPRVS